MNENTLCTDLSFVAFDTETSGKYPLESEICEIAAVKYQNGKQVGEYSTLVKPTHKMSDFVIGIHGITNEMVAQAPSINQVIPEFVKFCESSVLVAHHAPFDLGFLSIPIEANSLPLPSMPVICSSLLSRKVFPESQNHRLQTLAKFLNIDPGTAHRALSDAQTCMHLLLRCLHRLGEKTTIGELLKKQQETMSWERFSLIELVKQNPHALNIIKAIKEQKSVDVIYLGGSKRGEWRTIQPHGLVRSLDGDFFLVRSQHEHSKRFMFSKLVDSKSV